MFRLQYGQGPEAALKRNLAKASTGSPFKEVSGIVKGGTAVLTATQGPHVIAGPDPRSPLMVIGTLQRIQWFEPEWHTTISGIFHITGPGDVIEVYAEGEDARVTFVGGSVQEASAAPPVAPMTEEELTQIASEIYGTTPAVLKGGGVS